MQRLQFFTAHWDPDVSPGTLIQIPFGGQGAREVDVDQVVAVTPNRVLVLERPRSGIWSESPARVLAVKSVEQWTEEELCRRLVSVDHELGQAGVDIRRRLDTAYTRLLGEPLWASINRERPRHGLGIVFDVVHDWYSREYGAQAVGVVSFLMYLPAEVRQAAASIRIPMVFGRPSEIPLRIDRLGPTVVASLSEDERSLLSSRFGVAVRVINRLESYLFFLAAHKADEWFELLKNAQRTLKVAGEHFHRDQFNEAAFSYQQAVEKAIKAVLFINQGRYPFVHDFQRLRSEAGFPDSAALDQHLDHVSFPMSVRYDSNSVSRREVVVAADSSVRLVDHCLNEVGRVFQAELARQS